MKLNNNDDSHNSGLNLLIYNMLLDIESHPAWVCGLKRLSYACITFPPGSHPAWVCGLKLFPICQLSVANASHPAWVCGLKPLRRYEIYPHGWSHPAWVCGLKPAQILNANITTSHTLRGCVD